MIKLKLESDNELDLDFPVLAKQDYPSDYDEIDTKKANLTEAIVKPGELYFDEGEVEEEIGKGYINYECIILKDRRDENPPATEDYQINVEYEVTVDADEVDIPWVYESENTYVPYGDRYVSLDDAGWYIDGDIELNDAVQLNDYKLLDVAGNEIKTPEEAAAILHVSVEEFNKVFKEAEEYILANSKKMTQKYFEDGDNTVDNAEYYYNKR